MQAASDDDDSLSSDVEEEVEDEEEEDENPPEGTLTTILAQLVGNGRHWLGGERSRPAQRWRRLRDCPVLPLQHPIAAELLSGSTAVNKRRRCDAPSLDAGKDPSSLQIRYHGPRLHSQPDADLSMEGDRDICAACLRLPSRHSHSALAADSPDSPDASPSTSEHTQATAEPSAMAGTSPATTAMPSVAAVTPFATVAGPATAAVPPASSSQCPGQDMPAVPVISASQAVAPVQRTSSKGARGLAWLARKFSGGGGSSSTGRGGEEGGSGSGEAGSSSVAAAAAAGCGSVSKGRDKAGGSGTLGEESLESEEEAEDLSSWSGVTQVNTARLMIKRELGLGDVSRLSRSQQIHLQGQPSALPTHPCMLVEDHDSRCYIGQFSRDGAYFVAAYQDHRVRVYDVNNGWRLRKDVRPRGVRWTVTDTCTSPNQQFLIYCSINPVAHLVNISSSASPVESLANITEVHEDVDFRASDHDGFGIWSIRWSATGNQLIAGTNNESVYIYDVGESKVVAKVTGHNDDVNAVEYLDDTPNLILSGSDDSLIKLWDRRMMDGSGRRAHRAAGVMVGHTEGLTHLNAKGDGRYFISNCKDQTIKLWDVRQGLRSEAQAAQVTREPATDFSWDYRWMAYPGAGFDVRHPHDASVMTYRGHAVNSTLIRAYFSPAATTGQRFIYSGSGDDKVHIWDIVTGHQVAVLEHHSALVRDVSWHPTEPLLVSVSWDGSVVAWAPSEAAAAALRGVGAKPLTGRGAAGRRGRMYRG